jgi:hypothetical protein
MRSSVLAVVNWRRSRDRRPVLYAPKGTPVTTENVSYRQQVNDRNGCDHLPTCPRCGNLCAQVDKWCAECGVWLRLDPPKSYQLRSRAMQAASNREDVQATEGTEA